MVALKISERYLNEDDIAWLVFRVPIKTDGIVTDSAPIRVGAFRSEFS